MSDDTSIKLTAGDIAQRVGGALEGDAGRAIRGVAGLIEATAHDLAFLGNPRYAQYMGQTAAAAVIVGQDWRGTCPAAVIRVRNPEEAFFQIAALFQQPPVQHAPGIHATAVIAPDAKIGRDVTIGPFCVIGKSAAIGDRTVLVASCYIGPHATVGNDCLFYSFVTLREHTRVGSRTILHNGVVLGSDGFGYNNVKGKWQKIPQLGTVVVGDDVELGANCTVDRARFGVTRIGNGVKIDNLTQTAHNSHIGDDSILAGLIGLAGSVHLGRRVRVGGQAGINGHIRVGDDAVIGAQAGVTNDVPAGSVVFGAPAAPYDIMMNIHATIKRLPELKARIVELERQVKELQERLKDR